MTRFVCILFLLIPFTSRAASVVVDQNLAVVNSSLILLSDIIKFRKTLALRAQIDPFYTWTGLAAKKNKITDKEIVEFLMDEAIVMSLFPVTDEETENAINSIQVANRVDRRALLQAIKEQGFDFQDYFALIRTSTAKQKLLDRDISTKVYISEDDIKNHFYNQLTHKGKSLSYRIQILNFPSSEAADRARSRFVSGSSFEDVSKKAQEDDGASGGDLGFLSEEAISPQVRKVMKGLKIGEVSPVLKSSSGGFFFIKLADLRSGKDDQYEKLRGQIRGQMAMQEYQHQLKLWTERERLRAFIRMAGDPAIPAAYATK